jgi:hypothetical protein
MKRGGYEALGHLGWLMESGKEKRQARKKEGGGEEK